MAKQQKHTPAQNVSEGLPVVNRQTGSSVFNPDYSYVAENLKKIGILAACFITILIVLSFIL